MNNYEESQNSDEEVILPQFLQEGNKEEGCTNQIKVHEEKEEKLQKDIIKSDK